MNRISALLILITLLFSGCTGTSVPENFTELQKAYLESQRSMSGVLAAGTFHSAALKTDGTVVATGMNKEGQCDVQAWTDLIAVSVGEDHTVGLKADGTVVAVGSNRSEQCEVSGWRDIIQIDAGPWLTVGLKRDGTVVAAGKQEYFGKQEGNRYSEWRDIVQVKAGFGTVLGLRSDGTIVESNPEAYTSKKYLKWKGIVNVDGGIWVVAGLGYDQTVRMSGDRIYSRDFKENKFPKSTLVKAFIGNLIAITKEGKIATAQYLPLSEESLAVWTDIVAIDAGDDDILGLRSNGTVVAYSMNLLGSCDVSEWMDIGPNRNYEY